MKIRLAAVAAVSLASCVSGPLLSRAPSSKPPLPRSSAVDPGAEAAGRFLKARVAELDGDLRGAAEGYERVLQLDPGADEAHRHLLEVYARQGDPERAMLHARAALSAGTPDAETKAKVGALYEWIARDRIERGDVPGGVQALREKLELFPGDLAALEGIIRLQSDAGDEAGLIAALEERSRFHPENPMAHFELGFAYFELKRYADAVRELKPVLEAAPNDPKLQPMQGRIRFLLGAAQGYTGATAPALETLRGVGSDDAVFEQARAEEARILESTKHVPEAIRELQAAVKGRPFSSLHVVLAELLQRSGKRDQAIALLRQAVQQDSDQAGRARLALANVLREAGQTDKATEVLREVERGDPSYFEARLALVQLLENAGKIPAAIHELQALTQEQPEALQLQVYLAGLTRKGGDLPGATRILESVVKASEGSSSGDRARYALGRFYQEAGDDDRAQQVLEEIEKGTDVHSEARLVLAQIYEERGDFARAIAEVEGLIAERPGAVELQIYVAGLLQRSGDVKGALARLEKIEGTPTENQGRVRYALGRLYAESGRPADAERSLRLVPREDPVYPDAQIALVQLLDQQKRSAEALEAMRTAVSLRPGVVDLRVYLAELTQRTGDLPGAIRIMQKLIKDNPDRTADLQYRLGVIYGAAGQDDRALEIMTKVLQGEGKDDARVLNYVGYTWADQGVRLGEAEKMIRRAIELEPQDGAIADSLGWVLYKRGIELRKRGQEGGARSSMEAGLAELERAAKLEPQDPTITRHLGEVYRSLSRLPEAIGTFRHALELDIDDAQAQQIRREIELLEAELKGDRSGDAR